ncbi:MAG: zinc ribbon domain-containing protein [Eubacteriales bacterium]
MICPKCSTELLMDYTFCPQCGSKLPAQEVQADNAFTDVTNEDASEFAAPEVPVQSNDYFVTPSPLTETMPSPYISSEPSAFVAPAATQETFVSTASAAAPSAAAVYPTETVNSETTKPSAVRPGNEMPDTVRPGSTKPVQIPAAPAEKKEPVIPKELKPLTTTGIFWYLFLVNIPVIGWICLLLFALAGKNKSKRSLSRAILIYWIIFLLLICLAFVVAFVVDQKLLVQLFDPNNWMNLGDYLFQMFINH